MRTTMTIRIRLLTLVAFLGVGWTGQSGSSDSKARAVVEAAIEAMGGAAYLEVRSAHSEGRYFWFDRNGRKAFARFWDWTVYQPIKWRFQLGKGKRQLVQIYNLELGQGWKLQGKKHVEPIPEKDVAELEKSARRDLDVLLRQRLDEEGMSLFYYGPDDIAGTGEYEAVEFLDATNESVVVFFDRKTHLPVKMEENFTDRLGIRHKREIEFYNWHRIEGVMTPLRHDTLVDGRISQQRFIEKITFNPVIPPEYFLEPQVEDKD